MALAEICLHYVVNIGSNACTFESNDVLNNTCKNTSSTMFSILKIVF